MPHSDARKLLLDLLNTDMKKADIVRETGIGHSALSRIEHGKQTQTREPSYRKLFDLWHRVIGGGDDMTNGIVDFLKDQVEYFKNKLEECETENKQLKEIIREKTTKKADGTRTRKSA